MGEAARPVDLLILVAQLGLVLLLVVMPVMSGYDKFVGWSPARRLIALAIAVTIAAVVFTQYRHLRALHTESLAEAISTGSTVRLPWYARAVPVTVVEYLVTICAMGLVAAQAIAELKRKRWARSAPWVLACLLMPVLAMAIKLRVWR